MCLKKSSELFWYFSFLMSTVGNSEICLNVQIYDNTLIRSIEEDFDHESCPSGDHQPDTLRGEFPLYNHHKEFLHEIIPHHQRIITPDDSSYGEFSTGAIAHTENSFPDDSHSWRILQVHASLSPFLAYSPHYFII